MVNDMGNEFFAFLFLILIAVVFVGGIIISKISSGETVSTAVKTPQEVSAEMMQANMTAYQNQQLMKVMQLEHLRMETEMLELQQRKFDISTGQDVRDRKDKEKALQYLLQDIRDSVRGVDVSTKF
jgi:hypothetical protein